MRPLTKVDVSRSFRTKVSQGAGDMGFKFPCVIVDLKENGRIEKINPIIKDRDSFQQKTLNTSPHVWLLTQSPSSSNWAACNIAKKTKKMRRQAKYIFGEIFIGVPFCRIDLKDLIIPCTKLEWHTVNSHAVWLTQQKQTRFFGLLLRAMLPRLTLWKQTCKFSLWSTIAIMQTLPNT